MRDRKTTPERGARELASCCAYDSWHVTGGSRGLSCGERVLVPSPPPPPSISVRLAQERVKWAPSPSPNSVRLVRGEGIHGGTPTLPPSTHSIRLAHRGGEGLEGPTLRTYTVLLHPALRTPGMAHHVLSHSLATQSVRRPVPLLFRCRGGFHLLAGACVCAGHDAGGRRADDPPLVALSASVSRGGSPSPPAPARSVSRREGTLPHNPPVGTSVIILYASKRGEVL